MSIYLSHALQLEEIPTNTLQRIEQFKEKEKENSLSCFLLSYYYHRKDNHAKSIEYLRIANKISNFEDYTVQRKKITKSYLEKSKVEEICVLSQSMFTLTQFPFFLAKMSRDSKVINDKEFRNELFSFSQTFEMNSKDIISKLGSLSSQLQLLDKEKNPNQYEAVKSDFENIKELSSELSIIVSELPKEEVKKYMISAHVLGELEAAKALLAKQKKLKQ